MSEAIEFSGMISRMQRDNPGFHGPAVVTLEVVTYQTFASFPITGGEYRFRLEPSYSQTDPAWDVVSGGEWLCSYCGRHNQSEVSECPGCRATRAEVA